jgi:GAF domain-containing protein
MHVEDRNLKTVIGGLARRDLAALDPAEAITEVTGAMPALFGVDGAGVLLIDESQVLRYVAASDGCAHLLEAAQEATGTGPCVQALVEDVTVAVRDLATDGRWPDLADRLVPNGIRAVLGDPVHVGGTPIGSINVYKGVPYEWDDSDVRALAAFDRLVERLLTGAMAAEHHQALASQLQHALEARVVIERAVGVLVGKEDLDPPAAFERIRRAARDTRRSAREIAGLIVQARGFPAEL